MLVFICLLNCSKNGSFKSLVLLLQFWLAPHSTKCRDHQFDAICIRCFSTWSGPNAPPWRRLFPHRANMPSERAAADVPLAKCLQGTHACVFIDIRLTWLEWWYQMPGEKGVTCCRTSSITSAWCRSTTGTIRGRSGHRPHLDPLTSTSF